MPITMCVEIIYPFPNFNGATIEVWEWNSNPTGLRMDNQFHPTLYDEINYLSMMNILVKLAPGLTSCTVDWMTCLIIQTGTWASGCSCGRYQSNKARNIHASKESILI